MPRTAHKPVYAIVGPDRYLRRQALEELLRRLDEGSASLGTAAFRGKDAALAEVLDEARTPSLLGGVRTVIVDDADEFITEHRQALERYCAAPAECGTLVFVCQTMPSNTKLYRAIAKIGEVIPVEAPSGRELVTWIPRRAQTAHGKRMSAGAAQRLREQVGDSAGLLDAELAKLATYVGDRGEITELDIAALTGHSREEKVFAVMDAVFAGRPAEALAQWEHILATDRAASAIGLAGMAWSVRRLLKAKLDYEAGESLFGLAKMLFTDTATVERRLKATDANRLVEMQRDLLAADLAVKTGASTGETSVEKFIVKFSGGGGSRAKVG